MTRFIKRIKKLLNKGKFGYLAKNSLFFTISSFGSKLLSFFLIPLYTNLLSTSEMGMADIVFTTSSLLQYAVTLNISGAVFIFAMDKTYAKQPVFKYGIFVVIKGLLIFGAGLILFAWWNPVKWPFYCYIFLWIHLALTAFTSVVSSYLRAIDKAKDIAISGLITTAVTIGSNIFMLVIIHLGVIGYFASLTLGLLAGLVYLLINCNGLVSVIKGTLCEKSVKVEMLKYSIPLIINGISWWANSSLDRYFIAAISGADANGIYAISSKIPTVLSTLNTIFAQAWAISAIKEFDKEDESGFFRKVYTGYNFGLILCASILIIINVPLARILYAKDFFSAWKSSLWLIISVLFNSMAGLVGSVFGAVKNSKAYAFSTIGSAIINVILNLILIPRYQEVGAAIATASSFFTLWLFRYLYSRKFIHWKINIGRDLLAYTLLVAQIIFCFQEGQWYHMQFFCILGIIALYYKTLILMIAKVKRNSRNGIFGSNEEKHYEE